MTKELARALTDMAEIIKDWNSGLIPNEEEFIIKLKMVNGHIALALPKKEAELQQLEI